MARKVKTPKRTPQVRAMFEDLAFMGRTGCTVAIAAERMGVSEASLRKRIDRYKAFPLWNRLRENETKRFGATAAEVAMLDAASDQKFKKPRRAA